MGALLRIVIDICLLQKGPQDLPFSRALLYLMVLVYCCASLALLLLSTGFWSSVLQMLAEIALMFGFAWATLALANRAARIVQTAAALYASDALITLCAIPVVAAILADRSAQGYPWLILALMLWHWLVTGHIFRHALSTSFVFGLCLALLYIIGSYQIMALLFPAAGNV